MRAHAFAILVALAMLPVAALAQTAAPASPAAAPPAATATTPPTVTGITRDQYIERAEHSAAVRAGHRFDHMDANHDGILTPAEIHAYRLAHPRHYHKRKKTVAPASK